MEDAEHSPLKLYLLNQFLSRLIPFNKPHGVKIVSIASEEVRTALPFVRKNKNHLGGLHACALAALGEFTAGILILKNLGFTRYRLILSELHAQYHYQGKTLGFGTAVLTTEELEQEILTPLESGDAASYTSTTKIVDEEQRLLSTVSATWQIKEWTKTGKGKT